MTHPRIGLTILAAAVSAIAAHGASAMSLGELPNSASPSSAIIKVHGVHRNCQPGSVKPPYNVGPDLLHRTPEAGVHIRCLGSQEYKPQSGDRARHLGAQRLTR